MAIKRRPAFNPKSFLAKVGEAAGLPLLAATWVAVL
jgi:hypothetical protein